MKEDPDLSQEVKPLIDDATLYEEAFEILIDACKKGVSIDLMYDLPPGELNADAYDFPMIGLMYKSGRLSKQMPEVLKKHAERRKYFIRKKQAIDRAVRILHSLPLLPEVLIHPDTSVETITSTGINRELISLQATVKPILDYYLDFLAMGNADYMFKHWGLTNPRMWIKKKYKTPKREASIVLNEIIGNLVDKFIGIGYSENESYIRTAKLLNCFYPHFYANPASVSRRHTYHKRNK